MTSLPDAGLTLRGTAPPKTRAREAKHPQGHLAYLVRFNHASHPCRLSKTDSGSNSLEIWIMVAWGEAPDIVFLAISLHGSPILAGGAAVLKWGVPLYRSIPSAPLSWHSPLTEAALSSSLFLIQWIPSLEQIPYKRAIQNHQLKN